MKRLTKFIHDVLLSWANELRLIFKDKGVLMFLFVLPLAYPIIYALIYDKEVATDVPIVVVDQCNTPESRRLVRYADASQYAAFVGYASDMADAERALKEKKASCSSTKISRSESTAESKLRCRSTAICRSSYVTAHY